MANGAVLYDQAFFEVEPETILKTTAFKDLFRNINTRYILLSYNIMAQKGNDRSNAKIGDDDIMRILSAKGEEKVFTPIFYVVL